jgi:tRNA (cytidine/uridine-2'-O-)-methyltransferase
MTDSIELIENGHHPGFGVEVVLVEPEIPQNTGNIARTCAALGCPLHLIEPIGFSLSDRYLRRAGIDYWHLVEVKRYPSLDAFIETHKDGSYFFFSGRAQKSYHTADYRGRMYLIFGKESTGLSSSIVEKYTGNCYRLPMKPGVRSINLASAAAVILYEVFRQNGFPGIL